MSYDSFVDYGILLSKVVSKEDFELFVTIVWAVWSEICKELHACVPPTMDIKIAWPILLCEIFHNASKQCSSMCNSSYEVWKSPLPNKLRLDVDVGYNSLKNEFSVAVVQNSLDMITINIPESVK